MRYSARVGVPLPDTSTRKPNELGSKEALPRRFGKYTLVSKFATGGMAELFLALQRSVGGFEKMLIVKRILPNLAQDETFVRMLLSEARIAATLNHPNIAQIFDIGVEEGEYYIAMEHVHGEDLRAIVRAMKHHDVRGFPLEHTLAIVIGCAAALAHAHEQRGVDGQPMGIVHRDISPQNILVTFHGDVKLVDFGIAKASRSNSDITASGKLKGKAPYMSPEQAQGIPIDGRSDVFSLGVILFELSTGKRLFRGPTEYDTLRMIISEPYPAPAAVNPSLHPTLCAIIERALARNPDDRYQSAKAFQADLEDFARTEHLTVSTIALSAWMKGLFQEKLAEQDKLVHEGRKFADVLAEQAEEEERDRSQDRFSFMPSLAPRPAPSSAVVQAAQNERRGGKKTTLVAIVCVIAIVLSAIGVYVMREGDRGSIVLRSNPAGAAIWLDGDRRPERTPATITGLPLGITYSVKLTHDGFQPITQNVDLNEASREGSIVARLLPDAPPPASVVRITTSPVGAQIFLDGHDTGQRSPATLADIRPGVPHQAELMLDGYVPAHLAFTPNGTESIDRVVTLERTELRPDEALLRIVVTPADARVNVLGTWHEGGSPYEFRIPARATRVFVNRLRYRDTDRIVELPGGRVTEIEFSLTRTSDEPDPVLPSESATVETSPSAAEAPPPQALPPVDLIVELPSDPPTSPTVTP